MQAKKTNPEKAKNPEMLTLDSTYRIGNRSFIVEPVFKEESSPECSVLGNENEVCSTGLLYISSCSRIQIHVLSISLSMCIYDCM